MRTCIRITLIAIGFAHMASALPPNEVFVTTNGTGVGYPTWDDATNSIQGAINIVSSSGSTVWVDDGIYATGGVIGFPTGTIITNRVAITKPIALRSKNGPATTIIEGTWDPAANGNGPAAVRGVYMANGSSLIGFTVTNCATHGENFNTHNAFGAGIYGASTGTIVSNCVIVGNSAYGGGGGAYSGTLYDSVLDGNRAGYAYWWLGGGGAMGSTLYGCMLTNNNSGIGIGAFQCTLFGCTIAGNTLGGSGGVCLSTLTNCTLIGNNKGAIYRSTLYDCRLLYNTGNYGAGAQTECKLYGCTLIGNMASQNGGGVEDRCVLTDCLLMTNSAQYGGGASGNCILSNCTLTANSNTGGTNNKGGGADNNCVLYNCLLTDNVSAGLGGGGANDCTLHNCTVVSNTAGGASWETHYGGGVRNCTVSNSIVYFNTTSKGTNHNHSGSTFAYSCTAPAPEAGSGNITGNPKFVDMVGGDFRLKNNSPCIDTGMIAPWMLAALDLDGAVRIQNDFVDMGAYEHTPGPKRTVIVVR